jgi:hypothetical protein
MTSFKAHGGKEMISKDDTWKWRIYFPIGLLPSSPLVVSYPLSFTTQPCWTIIYYILALIII